MCHPNWFQSCSQGCVDHIPPLNFRAGNKEGWPSFPHLEVNGASLRGPSSEAELILPLGICQGGQDSTDYTPLTLILYMGCVVPKWSYNSSDLQTWTPFLNKAKCDQLEPHLPSYPEAEKQQLQFDAGNRHRGRTAVGSEPCAQGSQRGCPLCPVTPELGGHTQPRGPGRC